MNFNTIICEKNEGIGIITLNKPQSMNALDSELVKELHHAFDELADDQALTAVIICGSEKVFAAGGDIREICRITTPVEAHRFITRVHALFNTIEGFLVPVIAAISGLALGGGCELALACDIRIASETAIFGQPEINIGVIPGGGGTQRLPRLVGVGKAKELLYTGESIDAKEALRIGLVNKVVPTASLMDAAGAMAAKCSLKPAFALKMTKMAVNDGMNMDLYSALKYETRCFEWLFATHDQKEGMAAFIEKRIPKFICK
ncbi:MAG: enoyl-CoA hydratase/isomerase family protein [Proteobacteria bacterium]|nr:enoyl-CoA hydratase/isomerase family protein [Pseudomonadota bacterium]MBU1582841.1 enoyl-CoA hydratase/isomerase family protein [Pseudomonadota bacterium]MBU2451840.1 enoyl-CoA hydratase/isomerase family protein [Pseudomonadota bacterium]